MVVATDAGTLLSACPLLVNMVQAGHKGVKTGSGFYIYSAGSKDLVVAPRFKT